MIHFAVAFALLAHVLFWGAGAAMLAMPRPWHRFWPVLVLPMGFGLQSAVVWIGAHTNLPGTNSYALASEALPAVLLALALWRFGWRPSVTNVSRFGLVWAGVAACLALLVLPLALASGGLTTISLGSCDAADYAGGARVLMEFARGDREGFLGLTEVVRVQSVDNFFEYWTRLNHFTPSALIAFNGSVLGCAPHELTSLTTMLLLAGSLPVVFWSARAIFGYSGGVSLVVMALYGLSPVMWYAVGHVAPGQLLAAQAIALITWGGVALWRGRLTLRRAAQFLGVLALGYGLVLGSYTFFIVICAVPAMAFAGGWALWDKNVKKALTWAAAMLAPLALVGGFFWERLAGLMERFALLRMYDFGWRVPALTAEGWLGMVRGPGLEAWDFFGLRWVLAAGVVGVWGWAVIRAVVQRRRSVWMVAAAIVPVLAAYFYLQFRGAQLGTNASYDAYKLFAVFLPLLLPAFCWWVTLRRSRRLVEWFGVVGIAAVVLAFNGVATGMFVFQLQRAPLIVDGQMREWQKIEALAGVDSINVVLPTMWERLWANAFLLRKPHYFPTDTYEARWHTELKGTFDFEGGVVALKLPGAARREVSVRHALVDTRGDAFVRVSLTDGWSEQEQASRGGEPWRWTHAEAATVAIVNPHNRPIVLTPVLDARGFGEREVALVPAGTTGPTSPFVKLGEARQKVTLPPITLRPGRNVFMLASPTPAVTPSAGGDTRQLAVCVYKLELTPVAK